MITMYGADWCGDCIRAKRFFADNGIAYEYVDLIETPEGTDVVLERNGGVQKIPVIIFPDDSHLTEPSNAELEAKMASVPHVAERVEEGRFELLIDGVVVSFASYTQQGDNVVIPHVETAPQHRGNGRAGQLMEGVLEVLRFSDRTITPLCPFAAGHIRKNPQHHDLLTQPA